MNSISISKIARNLAIFTITLFVLGSCEKKENTIGSGFLDGEKFGSGIYRNTQILAFTKEKENIITSGSTRNLLGVYQDPIFGKAKSGFGIQLALSKVNPEFGANAKVDSVILTMPYLGKDDTKTIGIGDDEETIKFKNYDTDSIYGDKSIPMHIQISEFNKFLHSDSTYYSNEELTTVGSPIFEDMNFVAYLDSLTLYEHDRDGAITDTSNIPAAFRVKLDENFFQQRIINLNKDGNLSLELSDNAEFIVNYMNGLVFNTASDNGAIFTFDMFKGSSVVIYYKNDDTDSEGELLPPQSYELSFSNKLARVNSYEFDRASSDPLLVKQLAPIYDTVNGSEMIFLQGMSGLEANIKLFTDALQLDTLREQGWLINRAELVYRVAKDNESEANPPFKLLMANSDSLSIVGSDYRLLDQVIDPIAFDGRLNSDATILSDTEKRYYKFRITNHVSAILDGKLEMNDKGEYEVVYDDNTNYVIKLISYSGNESVSRVKINGTNASDTGIDVKNLFLEIHYSKK